MGYVKISTSLHRGVGQNDNSIICGGEAQIITILHKGGGSLGTTKNVHVKDRSAGCPKKVENRMMLEPKILTKIECSWAKFSHGYDLRALNPS